MTSLRRAATFTALCGGPFLSGCVSLQAPVDRTLTRGGVTAHVEKAGARLAETRVALTVQRVPPGLKLLKASLSAGSAPYCEGIQAERLARTPHVAAGEPLRESERLVLQFPEQALDIAVAPAPRLDLLVQSAQGTTRCLPFELTSGQKVLEWSSGKRFTVGLDMALETYPERLDAVVYTALFTGTVGVWVDRFHFVVGGGIGGAGCPDDRCTVDATSDSKINESTVFPLQAGVQTALWEPSEFSMGLGARYRAVKLVAETFQGKESYWAHEPALAPYVAIVGNPIGDTGLGGARLAFVGLEIPIGYAFTENGDHSLSIGVTLSMFATAF